MTYVFDVDGTLTLVGDRANHLSETPRNWDDYYARCGEDEPHAPVLEVLRVLLDHTPHDVWLLTGRRESVRRDTLAWLTGHRIDVGSIDGLLMRPDGDHSHDTDLKPRLLAEAGVVPDMVFEDRNSVVSMWRERGIPCAQVAIGDF